MGRSRLLPLSLPTSSPVVIIKFSFFSVSISTLQSIFYNLLANNSTNYFILFINSMLNYLFYYCYSFRFFFYFSIFRYPNVFIITIFFPHAINIVLINILNTINMYVKKLLKKLTVDYIRHTKSKTGYVSEKTMFLFSPFYVKCSGNSGYNQPYKSLTFSKNFFVILLNLIIKISFSYPEIVSQYSIST